MHKKEDFQKYTLAKVFQVTVKLLKRTLHREIPPEYLSKEDEM